MVGFLTEYQRTASKMFFLKGQKWIFTIWNSSVKKKKEKKPKQIVFWWNKNKILEKFIFADISLREKIKYLYVIDNSSISMKAFMVFLTDSWMSAYDGL